MRRDQFLADDQVAKFVQWASHLVRGEWLLEHNWKGKGPAFRCSTLCEAFQHYLWPNRVDGDRFTDTVRKFDRFREKFEDIGSIRNKDRQSRFIANAKDIAVWGGIHSLKFDDWMSMTPLQLQRYIDDTKSRLDPAHADTDDLHGIRMGSGLSKIYSALTPGLLIYDSRVACALACLVRLYCRGTGISRVPELLDLGMPQGRSTADRCAATYINAAEYTKANPRFSWLMQELVADPGDFAAVSEDRRPDALQSALFMLGYTRLGDDAITKLH